MPVFYWPICHVQRRYMGAGATAGAHSRGEYGHPVTLRPVTPSAAGGAAAMGGTHAITEISPDAQATAQQQQ